MTQEPTEAGEGLGFGGSHQTCTPNTWEVSCELATRGLAEGFLPLSGRRPSSRANTGPRPGPDLAEPLLPSPTASTLRVQQGDSPPGKSLRTLLDTPPDTPWTAPGQPPGQPPDSPTDAGPGEARWLRALCRRTHGAGFSVRFLGLRGQAPPLAHCACSKAAKETVQEEAKGIQVGLLGLDTRAY